MDKWRQAESNKFIMCIPVPVSVTKWLRLVVEYCLRNSEIKQTDSDTRRKQHSEVSGITENQN